MGLLSTKARNRLSVAMQRRIEAVEVADVAERQAASVPLIGTTTNLTGVNGSGNNAAPLAGTESRLDVLESKVDAVITALKNANLMAP